MSHSEHPPAASTAHHTSAPSSHTPLSQRLMRSAFWSGRRVAITGATGFLGSHLTRALMRLGAEVVILERDRVSASLLHQPGFLPSPQGAEPTCYPLTSVRGDLEDLPLLERLLGEHEIETVFHLAAQTIVGIANRNPLSTFESNIRGTYLLLEACRRSPTVKRIVMASSDKAYSPLTPLPYQENGRLEGRHPYDVSKSCADLIAQSYAANFGLPLAITRCANLFGPGDLNQSRLIPGTFRSILRAESPIIRSDGTPIRDYLYVGDAVQANLLLAQALDEPDFAGEAFNFGLETPISVIALVEKILEISGHGATSGNVLPPRVLNQPLREVQVQHLSSEKARLRLGFHPEISLEEGLRRIWLSLTSDVDSYL